MPGDYLDIDTMELKFKKNLLESMVSQVHNISKTDKNWQMI